MFKLSVSFPCLCKKEAGPCGAVPSGEWVWLFPPNHHKPKTAVQQTTSPAKSKTVYYLTGLSEDWLLPTSIHMNCSSIWDSFPGIGLWTWPFLSSCHYLKPVSQPVPTRRTARTLTSPAPFQFPQWGWLGPSWSLSLPWFLERLGLCLHPGRGQLRPSPLLLHMCSSGGDGRGLASFFTCTSS